MDDVYSPSTLHNQSISSRGSSPEATMTEADESSPSPAASADSAIADALKALAEQMAALSSKVDALEQNRTAAPARSIFTPVAKNANPDSSDDDEDNGFPEPPLPTPGESPSGSDSYQPAPPNLGGVEVRGSYHRVWIGGVPNHSFTGVVSESPESPYCYRETSTKAEVISYDKRTKGTHRKFKANDESYSLLTFQKDVLKHLREHGLDTVFYMTGSNPTKPHLKAREIISSHPRYTIASVKALIKRRLNSKFDSYSQQALSDSAKFLENSLDHSFKRVLKDVLESKPLYGPVLWMAIVEKCQPSIVTIVKTLKEKFYNLDLVKFAGEDVEQYCLAVGDVLDELDDLKALPSDHLSHILSIFCSSSVPAFASYWSSHQHKVMIFEEGMARLKREISESGEESSPLPLDDEDSLASPTAVVDKVDLPYLAQGFATSEKTFSYPWLLSDATKYYQTLVSKNGWHSITPQAKVAAIDVEMTAMKAAITELKSTIKDQSNQLKQYKSKLNKIGGGGNDSGGSSGSPPGGGGSGGGSSNPGSSGTKAKSPGTPRPPPEPWMLVAPTDGVLEKTVNGVKYIYCAKCRRGKGKWNGGTTAHHTSAHRGGKQPTTPSGDSTTPQASLAFVGTSDDLSFPEISDSGWSHDGNHK